MAHSEFNRQSLTAASLSGLGMVFSTGPMVLATFALFMLPMAKEFGWGRAEISLGLTISSGCAALADPGRRIVSANAASTWPASSRASARL